MKKILVLAVTTVLFAGLGACASVGKGKAPVIGKGKAPVAAPIVVKG